MIIPLKRDDMRGTIPPVEPIHGVFLCGGAIRRWFTGTEELSDVDVFAPSKELQIKFLATLEGAELAFESKNADTYNWDGIKVQFIKFYYPTLEAVLDSFDFNICQFGWSEQGIFATQEAVIGALRNHLAVHKIHPEYATDSLRRAFKYQLKGYIPCAGTVRDLALSFTTLTAETVRRQVEMSPKGGTRLIRFD